MAYLLTFESGHPGEMAARLAYFPRTLQTSLNDMERSGHVLTRRDDREKYFWLRREEWRLLITWPAGEGRWWAGVSKLGGLGTPVCRTGSRLAIPDQPRLKRGCAVRPSH